MLLSQPSAAACAAITAAAASRQSTGHSSGSWECQEQQGQQQQQHLRQQYQQQQRTLKGESVLQQKQQQQQQQDAPAEPSQQQVQGLCHVLAFLANQKQQQEQQPQHKQQQQGVSVGGLRALMEQLQEEQHQPQLEQQQQRIEHRQAEQQQHEQQQQRHLEQQRHEQQQKQRGQAEQQQHEQQQKLVQHHLASPISGGSEWTSRGPSSRHLEQQRREQQQKQRGQAEQQQHEQQQKLVQHHLASPISGGSEWTSRGPSSRYLEQQRHEQQQKQRGQAEQQQHEQQQKLVQHHLASPISGGSEWTSRGPSSSPMGLACGAACTSSPLTISPRISSFSLAGPTVTRTRAAHALPGSFVMSPYAAVVGDGGGAASAARGNRKMGVGADAVSAAVSSADISQCNSNWGNKRQQNQYEQHGFPAAVHAAPALAAASSLGVGRQLVEQQPILALGQGVIGQERHQREQQQQHHHHRKQQQQQHHNEQHQQAQHGHHRHLQTLQNQMQQLQQQVKEFASQQYSSLQQPGLHDLQQLLQQEKLVSRQLQLLVARQQGLHKGAGSLLEGVAALGTGQWEVHVQQQQLQAQQTQHEQQVRAEEGQHGQQLRTQQAQHGQQVRHDQHDRELFYGEQKGCVQQQEQQQHHATHLRPMRKEQQQHEVEQQPALRPLLAVPLAELEECLKDMEQAQLQQQSHQYLQPRVQQCDQLLQECFERVHHLQQLQQQHHEEQQQQQHHEQQQQHFPVQAQQQLQQQQQLLEECFQQLHLLVELQRGEQQQECVQHQLLLTAAEAAVADTCAGRSAWQGEGLSMEAAIALSADTSGAAAARDRPAVSAPAAGMAMEGQLNHIATAAGGGPLACAPTGMLYSNSQSDRADKACTAAAAASNSAAISALDLMAISASLDDILASRDLTNSLQLLLRSDSWLDVIPEMLPWAEVDSSGIQNLLQLEDLE